MKCFLTIFFLYEHAESSLQAGWTAPMPIPHFTKQVCFYISVQRPQAAGLSS